MRRNLLAAKRRARRDESGNALMLTLGFTTVFVLLVASVSGYSFMTSRTATIAGDRRSEIDAANDAMERAVQGAVKKVEADGFATGGLSSCDFASPFLVPAQAPGEGDTEVEVDCEVVSKSSTPPAQAGNRPPWAILTTNTGGKSIHQPSSSPSFVVQGDIKSAGTFELLNGNREGRALKVIDGAVLAKCDPATQSVWEKVLLIETAYKSSSCPATAPSITVATEMVRFGLPASVNPSTMLSPQVPGPCSPADRVAVFTEGYYGSDKLASMNARFADLAAATRCDAFHFSPGVYLFAWGDDELRMRGKVIAGTLTTNALTPANNPDPPFPGGCKRWAGSGVPADSRGALFLFAGSARIDIKDGGQAEFCPFSLDETNPNNSQHVSFRTIMSTDAMAAVSWFERRLAAGAVASAPGGFANTDRVNGPLAADASYSTATLAAGATVYFHAPLAAPIPTAAGLSDLTVDVRWKWSGTKPDHLKVRLVDASGNNLANCGPTDAGTAGYNNPNTVVVSTMDVNSCWWKSDAGEYIKQSDVRVKVEFKAKNGGGATIDVDDVVVNVNGALYGAWSPALNNNRYVIDNDPDTQITVWGTLVAPEAEMVLEGESFQCSRRGYLRGIFAKSLVFSGGASYQHEVGIGTPSDSGEARATVVMLAKVDGQPLVATKVRIRVTDTAGVKVADPVTTDYWLVDGSVDELPDPEALDPDEESCE